MCKDKKVECILEQSIIDVVEECPVGSVGSVEFHEAVKEAARMNKEKDEEEE
jgi:hypothetical protein